MRGYRTFEDEDGTGPKRPGDWPRLLLAIGQPVETLDEFAHLLEGPAFASGSAAEMSAGRVIMSCSRLSSPWPMLPEGIELSTSPLPTGRLGSP